jgi:stearoyl-CoA desaturase (delta-9 desaturase)
LDRASPAPRLSQRDLVLQLPAIIFLSIMHALALACLPYLYFYGAAGPEIAFHTVAYFLGGFGITALYHRAWTHNAVQFARPVEYILAICSTLVVQMPARQWISTHIKHHAHTDSEDDPHNIEEGFWWAHYEWIILAPLPKIELPARLEGHPVIAWQERWYWPISVMVNIVIPVAISVACGAPWWGGVLLSGLRLTITGHMVYAVNSVCHVWGKRPWTNDVTARDVWWFPFTLGEQYHNYHHAFPRDYRHGVGKFDFDPTKWLIASLAKVGLARNLFTMPERRLVETRRLMAQGGVIDKVPEPVE